MWVFFRWDGSSLYPSFHCFCSWQSWEEWHGSFQRPLQRDVHNVFKEEWLSGLQRKTTVKGKCVQHEFQLSFLIIPSGNRISSSRDQDRSGPSKQKISWILHGVGATCRGWGDLVQWHIAISNHFVRPLLLSLRLFRNGTSHGAVGVQGQASHSVRYYPSALLGATDSVSSAICFCPTDITTIPPPRRWSFQGKEIFSLTASRFLGLLPLIIIWQVPVAGDCPHLQWGYSLLSLKKETYLL